MSDVLAARDPEKDEDFHKKVRERAEHQRLRYEQQKKQEREQGQPEAE